MPLPRSSERALLGCLHSFCTKKPDSGFLVPEFCLSAYCRPTWKQMRWCKWQMITVNRIRLNEVFEKNVIISLLIVVWKFLQFTLMTWLVRNHSFPSKKGRQYYAVSDAVFCGRLGGIVKSAELTASFIWWHRDHSLFWT